MRAARVLRGRERSYAWTRTREGGKQPDGETLILGVCRPTAAPHLTKPDTSNERCVTAHPRRTGQKEGFFMPKHMVPRRGPGPRPLTAEEDEQRLRGLRILARMIVMDIIASQERTTAYEADCDRDAVDGVGDGPDASVAPSLDEEAA